MTEELKPGSSDIPTGPSDPNEHVQPFDSLAQPFIGETEAVEEREHTGILVDRNNPTAQRLDQAIHAAGGTIPYSQFMAESLFGEDGYYSSAHAKIRGQFITSPELSEGFNTSMGEATRKVWNAMGEPEAFSIVEMGAGNGTMAKDILVWARQNHPDFYNALNYTIVEYGDLAEKQRTTIAGASRRPHEGSLASSADEHAADLQKVTWRRASAITADFSDFEGVFLSNELPDAFPVEVVRNRNGQIQQKHIGIEDDQWVETWRSPNDEVLNHITEYELQVAEGCEEPVNLNAIAWQRNLDRALVRGAIITVDYGQFGPWGEPQATRTFPQEAGSEYRSPGYTDITSDINFEALRKVAERDGLATAFASSQIEFLQANGFPPATELSQHFTGRALMGAVRMVEDFGDTCQVLMTTRSIQTG